MDFSQVFDVCRDLASSAGEFASLAVLALVAYLLHVVRSVTGKLSLISPTKSRRAFASGLSPSEPRRRSSSAQRTAGATGSSPTPQPQLGANDNGKATLQQEIVRQKVVLEETGAGLERGPDR